MRKVFDISRRASASDAEHRQRFAYETDDAAATVATALRELNARGDGLVDVDGKAAAPIRFEHACLQRKCGACAMVINGVPRLACDTRLATLRGGVVTLAPLAKFAVVADLVVDRSAMFDQLMALGAWLEDDARDGTDTGRVASRRRASAFEASRCLQCGCCLEVCPNVGRMVAAGGGAIGDAVGAGNGAKRGVATNGAIVNGSAQDVAACHAKGNDHVGGHADHIFVGMAGMVPVARLLASAEPSDRARLAAAYRTGVYAGCGRSLACRDVCPAGIDIAGLMSRSNAVAVWRRLNA